MSKKNKGTKNKNGTDSAGNSKSTQQMEDSSKKYQGGMQGSAQNCNHKEGK